MNEEQWIERALIAEQKLIDIGHIATRHHRVYNAFIKVGEGDMPESFNTADDIANEIDNAMAFNPNNPMDWDFLQQMESAKCGYIVPDGHTYCRQCGGGGLDEGNECVVCSANGSHQHPGWANRMTA